MLELKLNRVDKEEPGDFFITGERNHNTVLSSDRFGWTELKLTTTINDNDK